MRFTTSKLYYFVSKAPNERGVNGIHLRCAISERARGTRNCGCVYSEINLHVFRMQFGKTKGFRFNSTPKTIPTSRPQSNPKFLGPRN